MTKDPNKNREALDRLADSFVDDVLRLPDDEILAEVKEDYGDPDELTKIMRALFERTISEEGKVRLAAVKKAIADVHKRSGHIIHIDRAAARQRYEGMIANDQDLSAKLTLAARDGEKQSERDIESAIEDLAELGVFDDGNDKK